jgi:hypothetical protein
MARRSAPPIAAALLALSCSGPALQRVAGDPAQPRCVIFFEGTDCDPDQGHSSCCTSAGEEMESCWTNDEARSMKVYGGESTVITVFDDSEGATHDDYFVLRKTDEQPICVGSFDAPRGRFDPPTPSTWFYSGGDGLDGKVSTFRWNDPRELEAAGRPPGVAAR